MNTRQSAPSCGFISLPLALALAMSIAAGSALCALSHKISVSMRRQLAIDRCVGNQALHLRDIAREIEFIRARMRELRAALAASVLAPELLVGLNQALQVANTAQKAELYRWGVLALQFRVKGCGGQRWNASCDSIPFVEVPPDILGPKPVEVKSTQLNCQVFQGRFRARAEIYLQEGDKKNEKWSAAWTPLGPSTF